MSCQVFQDIYGCKKSRGEHLGFFHAFMFDTTLQKTSDNKNKDEKHFSSLTNFHKSPHQNNTIRDCEES
ncbi:MAG: hypothetical protein PHE78_05400 [Candidatus Gastranaerophilales bacterium]|nr:hypothetical protein [Candidatus Gastranaerophilales bacterium]